MCVCVFMLVDGSVPMVWIVCYGMYVVCSIHAFMLCYVMLYVICYMFCNVMLFYVMLCNVMYIM